MQTETDWQQVVDDMIADGDSFREETKDEYNARMFYDSLNIAAIKEEEKQHDDLLRYIKINILNYSFDDKLPQAMITSLNKTLTYCKEDNKDFTWSDLLHELYRDRVYIDNYIHNHKFNNDTHLLNSVLVIVKNNILNQKNSRKAFAEDTMKRVPVIPCYDYMDDEAARLNSRFYTACGCDVNVQNKVRWSLVKAWLNGEIIVEGITIDDY